ncbi:MAG: TonB-dependent receptor domain-containing protein [Fidelibacterota bacterium]
MKSTFRALFFLWLGGFLAARQGDISGIVFDAATGLPLTGVNIVVLETGTGAVSNSDGAFRLDSLPPGQYTVVVSMIGFARETRRVEIVGGHHHLPAWYLKPVILESNLGIVVFGRERERALQHIQKTNLSTTESMISLVEGVSLIRRGNFAQEPVIRGLSGGQINMTINGMKSFGACTDRMDPISAYVEPDALGSVEIGKGSLSLREGATVGGSLNMTFLHPDFSPQLRSIWSLGGGIRSALKEKRFSANWQRSRPKEGLLLHGTYRAAKDYTAANGKSIPFSGYEKISINAGYLRQFRSAARLLLEIVSDDAWNVGYSALPMDVGYARMRLVGLTLKMSRLASWLPRAEWKVYGNLVDHWMDDSRRRDRFMNMTMDMPGKTRTAGSFLDMVFTPDGSSSLTLRSEFFWNSSYADMVMYPQASTPMKIITWPDMHRWNLGHYLVYQRSISPRTTLKSALRYDYYSSAIHHAMGKDFLRIYYPDNSFSRTDRLITGNVALIHRVNTYYQFTLAAGRGQRLPTVTEAYGYYLYNPVDGYLYLGNPDIPVETSYQIEIRNHISTDRIDLSTNLFRYRFQHYTVGAVMDTTTTLGYANGWKLFSDGGRATLTGAELSFVVNLNATWVLAGGMNFQVGRLVDLRDYIPMISPFEAHATITWQQKTFWIQGEIRGAGKQTRFSRLGGENATAGFLVYALKGELHFFQRFSLKAGIENLTNVSYHEHLDWGDILRPGRSLSLALVFRGGAEN